jgi:hypothetical protein
MTDKRIDQLPAVSAVADADLLALRQSSVTRKLTVQQFIDYLLADPDLETLIESLAGAGFTPPTGTGFAYVTSGALDAAAKTPTAATAVLNAMVGDSGAGGTKGLVPAPAAGDAAAGKVLRADGTWAEPRSDLLLNDVRGFISANSGRGLQYVAALDKVLYAESVSNGKIVSIDTKTDYPIPVYTSAKTPKGLVYAANANLAASRLWLPNGTTDLFSVNPNTWATDVSSAGSRCDYLLYCSGNGTLFGFDNGASKIREYNSTTGAQIGSDYANANLVANTTDTPAVYVAANNSIYFTDLFGTVRRFNCTSHAITSLGVLHTGAGATGASMMLGSDGLLYITNGGSTDKYKIKIVDPATDTVTATIDLSSNLTTVAGFYWVYEWRGYLYAGAGGSSPAAIVCVINMTTRVLFGSFIQGTAAASGNMAASPTLSRGYIACTASPAFSNYMAFDR